MDGLWNVMYREAAARDLAAVLEASDEASDEDEDADIGEDAVGVAMIEPVVETLIDAARGDSTTALRSFLDAGADPEALDKYGYSALHYAAMNRFSCAPSFIDHLLAAGADVHARNRAGYTALHCAMLRQQFDDLELCIERLVRAGARVEELTNGRETALALALIAGRGDVAKCMLGFGARMTAEDLRRHARARWIRTQRLWHTEEQALLLRIAKFDARVSSIEAAGGSRSTRSRGAACTPDSSASARPGPSRWTRRASSWTSSGGPGAGGSSTGRSCAILGSRASKVLLSPRPRAARARAARPPRRP